MYIFYGEIEPSYTKEATRIPKHMLIHDNATPHKCNPIKTVIDRYDYKYCHISLILMS